MVQEVEEEERKAAAGKKEKDTEERDHGMSRGQGDGMSPEAERKFGMTMLYMLCKHQLADRAAASFGILLKHGIYSLEDIRSMDRETMQKLLAYAGDRFPRTNTFNIKQFGDSGVDLENDSYERIFELVDGVGY